MIFENAREIAEWRLRKWGFDPERPVEHACKEIEPVLMVKGQEPLLGEWVNGMPEWTWTRGSQVLDVEGAWIWLSPDRPLWIKIEGGPWPIMPEWNFSVLAFVS